jgi:hypothetical protein
VFLTGRVEITRGGRAVQVFVQAFDGTDKKLVPVCDFPVAAEPCLLTEAGVSFALSRGAKPEDAEELVAAPRDRLPAEATVVVPNKGGQVDRPKERVTVRELLKQAPIEFQVLYKDKGAEQVRKVDIKDDGTVEQPREGTEVSFRLKRKKNGDKHTYGVVFKVNGENTIYPEELEPDDFRAHKWVLDPRDDDKDFPPISGFLKKGAEDQIAKFHVLSVAESRREEVNYGPHAGMFTIVIFRGRPDNKDQPDSKESEIVRAISRGVPDEVGSKLTLQALKSKLESEAQPRHKSNQAVRRGLIVDGELTKQVVETVDFAADPTWESVIHLRYYKRQDPD